MQKNTEFDYQQLASELLNVSSLGLLILDENRHIVWCNGQFAQWVNQSAEQLTQQPWASLPLEACDQSGSFYLLFNKGRGDPVTLSHWETLLPSVANYTVHYFRVEARSSLSRTASKAIPQAPKRPSWVQFLDYEVSRSRRYNNPLSLLKLSIVIFNSDEFSKEEVNQDISETLRDELRWADMIGHSDEGDFLIVLPETPPEALTTLINKIDGAISSRLKHTYNALDYKVVTGEAHWQKGDNSGTLLERARDDLLAKLEVLRDQYQQSESMTS